MIQFAIFFWIQAQSRGTFQDFSRTCCDENYRITFDRTQRHNPIADVDFIVCSVGTRAERVEAFADRRYFARARARKARNGGFNEADCLRSRR